MRIHSLCVSLNYMFYERYNLDSHSIPKQEQLIVKPLFGFFDDVQKYGTLTNSKATNSTIYI